MTQPESPFEPFAPALSLTPIKPEPEQKKPRKPRQRRPKEFKKTEPPAFTPPGMSEIVNRAKTKKRKVKKARTAPDSKAKRAPKYELQTILRIAAALKEGDQKIFEKLLGELSALAKASRERVLKALAEVFS